MLNQVAIMLQNDTGLYEQMLELSKHKLEKLIKIAGKATRAKYKRNEEVLYGDLNKGYTKEQLVKFVRTIYKKETKRIFLIQFFFGLRIGELYDLEYLPQQKLLKIHNTKCSKQGAERYDYLPIHGKTAKLFQEPLHLPHIDNLRRSFENTNRIAGLEYIYHEGISGKLKLYTPHTLRHTAITIFGKSVKDGLLAMHFSRHRSKRKQSREFGCLPIYFYYSMDDMRKDLEKAFKKYYYLIN